MDAGRKHETPGLGTKDSLLPSAVVITRGIIIFWNQFPKPCSHRTAQPGPYDTCLGWVTEEEPQA